MKIGAPYRTLVVLDSGTHRIDPNAARPLTLCGKDVPDEAPRNGERLGSECYRCLQRARHFTSRDKGRRQTKVEYPREPRNQVAGAGGVVSGGLPGLGKRR